MGTPTANAPSKYNGKRKDTSVVSRNPSQIATLDYDHKDRWSPKTEIPPKNSY